VIGAGGPIENAYRFENEPARHKLLDLIGDLALAGRPLHGEVTATRAGHAMNHEMARALAAL
jgi:UDP-3-O-acyl-N-acetylglucosamine deacetylase